MESTKTLTSRIYLIGYSYSGKSTMGRQLSEKIGYSLFDTDRAIEEKYHTSIPMFFNRYGEKAFRIIERQILFSTADMDHVVVATGGGLPCNDENIDFIVKHGTAIHLTMSVDDIMERISKAHKGRPSMSGMSIEEKRAFICRQMEERLPYYTQAHIAIPALHLHVDDIMEELERLNILSP
ncbi:MAG: shikimate kinase [Bacteroidales bacterium]|nr:shikimate kinase [Bacteroidales bacterium]